MNFRIGIMWGYYTMGTFTTYTTCNRIVNVDYPINVQYYWRIPLYHSYNEASMRYTPIVLTDLYYCSSLIY